MRARRAVDIPNVATDSIGNMNINVHTNLNLGASDEYFGIDNIIISPTWPADCLGSCTHSNHGRIGWLMPIQAAQCPANNDLLTCNNVGCGDLCEVMASAARPIA